MAAVVVDVTVDDCGNGMLGCINGTQVVLLLNTGCG